MRLPKKSLIVLVLFCLLTVPTLATTNVIEHRTFQISQQTPINENRNNVFGGKFPSLKKVNINGFFFRVKRTTDGFSVFAIRVHFWTIVWFEQVPIRVHGGYTFQNCIIYKPIRGIMTFHFIHGTAYMVVDIPITLCESYNNCR